MKYLIIVALTIAVAGRATSLGECGRPLGPILIILGGDNASRGEFPWQVSIQRFSSDGKSNHICGGVIISSKLIFTAAHCLEEKKLRIVFGAYDITAKELGTSQQTIDTDHDAVIHPEWSFDDSDYDYALIKLPRPLDLHGRDWRLNRICMPKPEMRRLFENNTCMITGWGDMDGFGGTASILQKMPVLVPTHRDCVRAWNVGGRFQLTPRHICAATLRGEGTGICSGDSGGPLQCYVNGRYYLAGIASFALYCGSVAYPNVYARVNAVLDWVREVQGGRSR